MTDSASPMHCEAEGKPLAPPMMCETCGTPFTPKRAWARFCDDRCRNAFHSSEVRAKALQAKAVELYEALRQIAEGGSPEIARRVLKGLKPPESPKALLEKGRP